MSSTIPADLSRNRDISSTTLIDKFLTLENFNGAWSKVSEKKGCAGIDGETLAEFSHNLSLNLTLLRDSVSNGSYQPLPWKQVLISKGKGKWRELKIPTVRDRIVQQALLNTINPMVEPRFSPASFAYRPQLSYINAVERIADYRDAGYQWVLDADIRQYFDSIDCQRLLQEFRKFLDIPGFLCLIKAWITVGTMTESGLVILAERGIPQGAVISPLLANIYLDEFDRVMTDGDTKLVRYADDFLVLTRTQEQIFTAYQKVSQVLNAMGLSLHPEKTQITHFQRGFRFLGHGFLEDAIFPVDSAKKGSGKKPASRTSKKKEVIDTTLNPISSEESQNNNIWHEEMATLYLMEQGTSVYKDYQRLIIHHSETNKLEIPLREIERLLIFGNVQLSTPVINACLQAEIMVLFLSQSGQYHGHLSSLNSLHLHQELIQLSKQEDELFRLEVCRGIVRGKLLNSKQLLLRLNRKRKVGEVEKAILGIGADLRFPIATLFSCKSDAISAVCWILLFMNRF